MAVCPSFRTIVITVCALWLSVSVQAQQAPVSPTVTSADRAYFERFIKIAEPEGPRRPDRLPQYIEFFKREMINDVRLFAFDVQVEPHADGQIVVRGYVEFEENRSALIKYLRCLGFDRVDDRTEVLPSEDLGPRQFGFVKAAHSLSFDRPSAQSEVVSDCLLGSPLYLLKEMEEGYYLCHSDEGYVGYVAANDVHRVDAKQFARYVNGPRMFVRKDWEASETRLLPVGSRLKCAGREQDNSIVELPTGERVAIPNDRCEIHDGNTNGRVERILDNAQGLLGTGYLWGGKTSQGVDCSGLVQVAFGAEGFNLPRDSNQQVYLGALVGTRWYRQGLRPGDTLYFLGRHGKIRHTGIYQGNGKYIESVRPAVQITSFNPEDEDYNARRAASFAFAKRLLD